MTPLLTHWSYRSLVLTRRHVRGNVRNYKTGHCHAECNVPALWPPSYFEDFSHDKLVICFLSCNLPFCGLIGNISVTFVENGLLITPIYFVIEAQIHTNSYTLQRCQMTVMSSQITGQQTVCSTLSSDKQHRNIKGPYYRPFVKGVHRWRVDSSHKGTVTQNTFSFDDVIM